jgi:NTP pyrophosphatase (non-canonical NTP hydrolase)
MENIIDQKEFLIDMLHNVEELSELQKEIIKFARGKLRLRSMRQEINDVNIAIGNLHVWMKKFEEQEKDLESLKSEL